MRYREPETAAPVIPISRAALAKTGTRLTRAAADFVELELGARVAGSVVQENGLRLKDRRRRIVVRAVKACRIPAPALLAG